MIQFDQISLHPKYNLITKTTFKIMFICKHACHKVYEIALNEVFATQMGVTAAQHPSQLV